MEVSNHYKPISRKSKLEDLAPESLCPTKMQTSPITKKAIPVRFSWSHFEFLGLIWLSHHQEYLRFESAWDSVAMIPAKITTTFETHSQANCKPDSKSQIMEQNAEQDIDRYKAPNLYLLAGLFLASLYLFNKIDESKKNNDHTSASDESAQCMRDQVPKN